MVPPQSSPAFVEIIAAYMIRCVCLLACRRGEALRECQEMVEELQVGQGVDCLAGWLAAGEQGVLLGAAGRCWGQVLADAALPMWLVVHAAFWLSSHSCRHLQQFFALSCAGYQGVTRSSTLSAGTCLQPPPILQCRLASSCRHMYCPPCAVLPLLQAFAEGQKREVEGLRRELEESQRCGRDGQARLRGLEEQLLAAQDACGKANSQVGATRVACFGRACGCLHALYMPD